MLSLYDLGTVGILPSARESRLDAHDLGDFAASTDVSPLNQTDPLSSLFLSLQSPYHKLSGSNGKVVMSLSWIMPSGVGGTS